jgi:hypothetical protein
MAWVPCFSSEGRNGLESPLLMSKADVRVCYGYPLYSYTIQYRYFTQLLGPTKKKASILWMLRGVSSDTAFGTALGVYVEYQIY